MSLKVFYYIKKFTWNLGSGYLLGDVMGLVVFCKERRTSRGYSHTSITGLYLVE